MTEPDALDQFFTPPKLAARFVEWANPLPGERILEPSAGKGAIANLLPPERTWAVEIDDSLIPHLTGPNVCCADFLTWDSPGNTWFDLVIGNPPYGSVYLRGCKTDLDLAFVRNSLLRLNPNNPNARICFLLQSRFLHAEKRYRELWGTGRAYLHRAAFLVKRPDFDKTPGTPGPRGDYVLLDVRRVPAVVQTVQWLPDSWD